MNPTYDLSRQLRWLISIRLVVITSVVLPYFLVQLARSTDEASPFDTLYLIAGLTYLASVIYIALLRLLATRQTTQAYIQFVGDLFLITALVYAFGGITSPFSMLYLIVIAVAATMLRRSAGTTVATIAYALYSATLLGIYFHWLPGPIPLTGESGSLWRLTYNLAVHLFGFYAVAQLTSYLGASISRAERELARRAESLADLEVVHRDVIQSISSGLVTTDPEGRLTSANRMALEILNRSERELLGRHVTAIGLLDAATWAASTRETRLIGKSRVEVDAELPSGSRHIGYSLTLLLDAGAVERGYILIFQDLTEWRELQENLRLRDRMAAVGQLAAGLAHEIGNPLAAISGSVQMLSTSFPEDSPRRKLIDILLKESQRLDRTIKGFLRFARPKDRQPVRFAIAPLLEENVALLRNSNEVLPGHTIELELENTSTALDGDPDQISQIFWNLARNSLRAMPGGGQLRISGRRRGQEYLVAVSDTGRGMSESERANLFHPFQSFFDGGTGIGMAIVYRIVQDHQGRLEVQSRLGEGTTIQVLLPLAQTHPAHDSGAHPVAVSEDPAVSGSGVRRLAID